VLELGREGKFSAKATGWDENKVIKPGEKIEISAVHGRWLIVKVPPPAVEAAPAEAVTLTSARSRCGETGNRTDTQEQVEGRCRASGIDQ